MPTRQRDLQRALTERLSPHPVEGLADMLPGERVVVRHGGIELALRLAPQAPAVLDLKDFQPRSMLKVPVTRVPRAKFPVIE